MKTFKILSLLVLLAPCAVFAHGHGGGGGGIPMATVAPTNQPAQGGLVGGGPSPGPAPSNPSNYSYAPSYSPNAVAPAPDNRFADDMSPGAAGPMSHPNWNYPAPWEPGAGGFYNY